MSVAVTKAGEVTYVEVLSRLGTDVVSLEVKRLGEERENNDQDYQVTLRLADVDVLWDGKVTRGSWDARVEWEGPEA